MCIESAAFTDGSEGLVSFDGFESHVVYLLYPERPGWLDRDEAIEPRVLVDALLERARNLIDDRDFAAIFEKNGCITQRWATTLKMRAEAERMISRSPPHPGRLRVRDLRVGWNPPERAGGRPSASILDYRRLGRVQAVTCRLVTR